MGKQPTYYEELGQFGKYIKSDSNEDAKRPLLYPLFRKLFGDKFKIESEAKGADVYVDGQILVEAKTSFSQWLEGFYQALHYQKRHGLAYSTIMVVAHEFVGIWKLKNLPETAVTFSRTIEPTKAPNVAGKENAKRTQILLKREIRDCAFFWLEPSDLKGDIFAGTAKSITRETYEILKVLRNLDSDRTQINTHNFIHAIERMKSFFAHPIDAVHAFYTILPYWDITSSASVNDNDGTVAVTGVNGKRRSDGVPVSPRHAEPFIDFVDKQYVFTNEGSGLTVDYYFSRFDEVLSKIDPEYVKQHGIFFTNGNLSKFALWFVQQSFAERISEDYIVFDPAGGSGNLVSSWRGKLKHKIISELQPDLLRIIERRMKADLFHIETGFTIIPRTSENRGLNFLDRSAEDYLAALRHELERRNVLLDKPLAFLLNPPYKNTDENQRLRVAADAQYDIHPSILQITGEDAGKERYLAFLGQILNMCKVQTAGNPGLQPVVMIFTPTSWLIPRPTYVPFRRVWDAHFAYHSGFIVTSNEWFDLDGRWPLAFTIWTYAPQPEGHENTVRITDLTHLGSRSLDLSWIDEDKTLLEAEANSILATAKTVSLGFKGSIKELLPMIKRSEKLLTQPRYDYSTAKKQSDYNRIVSGFPLKDNKNHLELNRKCGDAKGIFIGFMDDSTPVRVSQDSCLRMSNQPDRLWFRLDSDFKGINKTKIFNGAADNRSYCAYDLDSAKATCSWFAITKALNGRYPLWANQYDVWSPAVPAALETDWYSLCFALVLAENRCVVTKFEKDNPVAGTPEIFVDNPLCPANPQAFWNTDLDSFMAQASAVLAKELVAQIKELYRFWNANHCKGQWLEHVGLKNEPYFKYFAYPDFLTPYSGLIQIRKYADNEGITELTERFARLSQLTKQVRDEIYRMLMDEFHYFK